MSFGIWSLDGRDDSYGALLLFMSNEKSKAKSRNKKSSIEINMQKWRCSYVYN